MEPASFMPPRHLLSDRTLALEVDGVPMRDYEDWDELPSRIPQEMFFNISDDTAARSIRPFSIISVPGHGSPTRITSRFDVPPGFASTSFLGHHLLSASIVYQFPTRPPLQPITVEVKGIFDLRSRSWRLDGGRGDDTVSAFLECGWLRHDAYTNTSGELWEGTFVERRPASQCLGSFSEVHKRCCDLCRYCIGDSALYSLSTGMQERVVSYLFTNFQADMRELAYRFPWLGHRARIMDLMSDSSSELEDDDNQTSDSF